MRGLWKCSGTAASTMAHPIPVPVMQPTSLTSANSALLTLAGGSPARQNAAPAPSVDLQSVHNGPGSAPASEPPSDVVTLPDGPCAKATVVSVVVNLERFVGRTSPIDTYELHQKCLDPNHQMFGRSGQRAEEDNLMQAGVIHDDVRRVILASLRGDGFDWEVRNPLG